MKKRVMLCNLCAVAAAAVFFAAQQAAAQSLVTFAGKTVDSTDYSPAGLNIGTAGYWFPQFNIASAPVTNRPVGENDVRNFPSWVLPSFDPLDPNYSFAQGGLGDAYSEGGDTLWDFLTLPNGANGLSGALVDPSSANSSSNSIRRLLLGPGTPQEFLFHIVTDNTNLEHDPARRVRVRLERAGSDIGDADVTTQIADFNATADVFTYRIAGALPGDIIKMQLNSRVAAERAGIGGLMFDVTIPEPASAVSFAVGGIALAGMRRRFARRA